MGECDRTGALGRRAVMLVMFIEDRKNGHSEQRRAAGQARS